MTKSRNSGATRPTAAATSLPKPQPAYVHRDVETALIDDPEKPARETFDEIKLQELIESIGKLGIIEPLIVKRKGPRFSVIAGHRRLVAARALELPMVPCNVYPEGVSEAEAMKAAENEDREDLNAAEQARYYGRLLQEDCAGDTDKLCVLLRKERAYVESRLLLLVGDPKVLDALAGRAISLGVAGELNKVKNPGSRLAFLDAAIQGGATVRMVRDWRVQAEAYEGLQQPAVEAAQLAGAAAQTAPVNSMICLLCDRDDAPHDMELTWLHRTCRRIFLDRFLSQLKAGPVDQPNGDSHA
jgi:ParB/RepB/Spo0J family partition protein